MKMTSEKGCRKDKNQNIQVFVRLRPLNQRERDIKSLGVVEVVNGREVVVRQSQQSLHTKRFTFDRAFPPHTKQVEVYQDVVSPLIEEVLAGYNCTVFAYGQTGTGKTHTMVGEAAPSETTWQTDPLAGIIPRALSQLFDELRISNTEYTVRVSYLELYNEELFDLLSTSEDNSKLRIYEDVTRKGANIVNGLEEITVYNKNEVYKIMAQGQERKRVASTLMNAQSSNDDKKIKPSSRSHTVFTIVVHMKENSPEGEELVKIGKLNLVDLAGSENISKAGSDNPAKRERARECVNINQSLLTLGRVITALVERHPHIPYRESKLTRILQESLGGRTKTSIIATISPGHKDLEETMSTLEYANRAKNIQNKPEVNQKMTKKAILKDYAEEIDRLKRDLHAAREKNGVYLANDTFTEMTLKQEEQRKEIQELLLKKRAMEEEREKMENVFEQLNGQLQEREMKLSSTIDKLCSTQSQLANTANILNTTKLHYEEQQYLVSKQAETEGALSSQARQLLAAAEAASSHAGKLHDTVDRRRTVESTNLEITRTYREISSQHRNTIVSGAENFVGAITQALGDIQTELETYTNDSSATHARSKQTLDELVTHAMETMNKMTTLKSSTHNDIIASAQKHSSTFHDTINTKTMSMHNLLERFAMCIATCLRKAGDVDLRTDFMRFLGEWQNNVTKNLSSVRNTHSSMDASVHTAVDKLRGAACRQHADRRSAYEGRMQHIQAKIDSIIFDKDQTERRLMEQHASIEQEKTEFEARLTKWAEEERRLLEERIERHVTAERNILEDRLKRRSEEIELQKKMFEERCAQNVEWLNDMLDSSRIEIERSGEDLTKYEAELDVCLRDLKMFVDECDKDSAAISSNIESLSDDALQVVEKVKTDLVNELQQAHQQVQLESTSLSEENRQSMTQLASDSDKMIESMVQSCHHTMDAIVGEVNNTSSSTVQELASLSSTASSLSAACQALHGSQQLALSAAGRQLEQFYSLLRDQLARTEELEGRCLHQEYAVYNPTGQTPVRTEYKYPRVLAATSPHERILARFRAMRQNSAEDDCILIEGEGEARSDTDSSASEDSVFAAPSPPAPPAAPTHTPGGLQPAPMVKCTSETDIYMRRRQLEHGKENANRSISSHNRKPSKLPAPAPTSHKKPLVQRNEH